MKEKIEESAEFTEDELKVMYPGREHGGLLSLEERNSLASHFQKVFDHCEEVRQLQQKRVEKFYSQQGD